MAEIFDEIIHKLDRILALLEQYGVTSTRIIAERNGVILLEKIGPYGAEYIVETPDGRQFSYGRLSTARKWFLKFAKEQEQE